jgi:hypothetical protein
MGFNDQDVPPICTGHRFNDFDCLRIGQRFNGGGIAQIL